MVREQAGVSSRNAEWIHPRRCLTAGKERASAGCRFVYRMDADRRN